MLRCMYGDILGPASAGPIHISLIVRKVMHKFKRQSYPEDNERARDLTRVRDFDPSKTQAQFKDDADLNVLVKRFGIDKNPVPPALMDPEAYGAWDDEFNLRTALDRVRSAQAHFDALPSAIRNRFDNSPVKFASFLSDPSNLAEAVKLGLVVAPGTPGQPGAAGSPPATPGDSGAAGA